MKKKNILLLILCSIFVLNCLTSLSFAEQPAKTIEKALNGGENIAAQANITDQVNDVLEADHENEKIEAAQASLAKAEAEMNKLEELQAAKAKKKVIAAQITIAVQAANDALQKTRMVERIVEHKLAVVIENMKNANVAVKMADNVLESAAKDVRQAARAARRAAIYYPDDDEIAVNYDAAYLSAEEASLAAEKELIAAVAGLEEVEKQLVEAGKQLEAMAIMREKADSIKALADEASSKFW